MHKCPGCVCEGQEVCRPPLEGLGNQAVQHFVALTSACTHTGEGLPCGCVGTTQQPHPKLCRHPYKTKPKCSCTTNSITFLSLCSFSVHDRPVYSKKKERQRKKKTQPSMFEFFRGCFMSALEDNHPSLRRIFDPPNDRKKFPRV